MTDDAAREALRFLMKDTLQRSDKDLDTVRAFLINGVSICQRPERFCLVIGDRFAGKEIAIRSRLRCTADRQRGGNGQQ